MSFIINPYIFGGIPQSNLLLWFKADSLALSNNDPVSTWNDESGNANHGTASGSQRPTFKTNQFLGKPAVEFDGTNHFLDLTNPISSSVSTFTGFAVIKVDTSVRHSIFGNKTSSGAAAWGPDANNGMKQNFAGQISDYVASATVFYLLAFDSNGSNAIHFFMNGQAVGTVVAGATFSQAINAIGKNTGSSYVPFDGLMFELILYSSVLGSTDRQTVMDYLSNKYHADGFTTGPVATPNCVGWWKADALSLSDNDPVNSWLDSSGYGLTLAPGNAPTFKTNQVNSLPVVRFDGSNDRLLLPYGLGSGPLTIFTVSKPLTSGTRSWIAGPTSSFGYEISAGKQRGVRVSQNVLGTATNAHSGSAFQQSNVTWDNANIIFRLASAANGSAAFALAIANAMTTVGAQDGGGQEFADDLAELAVYCRILSGGEISAIEAALASKYAIS